MRADSFGLFWEDLAKIRVPKVKYKREAPARVWEDENYVPDIPELQNFNFNEMHDLEIMQAARNRDERLVWDIECYINYFLIAFKSRLTGKYIYFERIDDEGVDFDRRKLEWVMRNFLIISFNGNHYDIPIASLALAGHDNAAMKAATNLIIGSQIHPSLVLKQFRCKKIRELNHIDLKEVAPLQASLKIYSGRIHAKRMQDLPFQHEKRLTRPQKLVTKWYCANDLENTEMMDMELAEQLHLRTVLSAEYDVDVRSKSDAQIAEALISKLVNALNGGYATKPSIPAGTTYYYEPPRYLKYQSAMLNHVLETVRQARFIVAENGSIGLPMELADMELPINGTTYKMGIGGLHSMESKQAVISTDTHAVLDVDFDSFYPKIIESLGLYPHQLGPNFLKVYSTFINRRLHAKRTGDKTTSNSLKIVINGSFGKFGSPFSILYAPKLLIQTTITGQLILLMFIETLELNGIHVVSANTDGIVSHVPRDKIAIFRAIVKHMESVTTFTTEETEYTALFSRDVNNYAAVKKDKDGALSVKGKGIFANPWHPANKKDAIFRFHKNPTNTICIDAIMALFTKNVPIQNTIKSCTDITKFVTVRKVKDGAVKSYAINPDENVSDEVKIAVVKQNGFACIGENAWVHSSTSDMGTVTLNHAFKLSCTTHADVEYLGESIRWYYAKDVESDIMYAASGNAVPKSKGAKPLMLLPNTLPQDIDYDWYIAETEKILRSIAYLQ